jgi:hypothetical protein
MNKKVCTITESEIRIELQKALHGRLSWAEWQHLKDIDLVGEYSRDVLDWREFRGLAVDAVRQLRLFYANKQRELSENIELGDEAESSTGGDTYQGPIVSSSLSDRTFARSTAIGSLNWLRTSGGSSGRAAIHGTLFPRGGLDGTLPQWVYVVAVELWVPAEEVMRNYRSTQRTLLAKPNPPKTSERAFDVASFVWQAEAHYGERPPWPVLWKHWNERHLAAPFKNWRDFRTYFLRGEEATQPRYVASDKQLTEEVRHNARNRAATFRAWGNQVLEGTVPQPNLRV